MHTDVLIVGGGLAGLACAVGLRASGLTVTLVEQGAVLGGRARSWVDARSGDVVDIGPHVLLSEYRNMLRLLEILGTRDRVVWDTQEFITLVENRRPVPMRMYRLPPPFHFLPSFLTTAPVALRDAHSNRHVTWLAMKIAEADVLQLDRIRADDFLRRMGVTPRFQEWFWASTCMAIMNLPLEQCSAGALLRFFRLLISYNDLKIGFPDIGLGELYVPPAARLIEAAGGRILISNGVRVLTGANGAVTGAVLADGTRMDARFCVAAVEPRRLHAMLPAEWVSEHKAFRDFSDFEPNPYISTYVWFDRKLTRATNWARAWSPTNLNYDFYDLSNIRRGWADRPSVIASNIIYSHRAHGLNDDEIVTATVREIADFLPQAARAKVRHAQVHRIPMAIPCPYPGTERKRPETRSAVRGLYLAGDWTHTALPACMEGAVRSGWTAAEQVLADAGAPRKLVLDFRAPAGFTGLAARWAKSRSMRTG